MSKSSGKGTGNYKTSSKKYGSGGSVSYLSKMSKCLSKNCSNIYGNLSDMVKPVYDTIRKYLGNYTKQKPYSFVPVKKYGLEGLVIEDVKERRCPKCGSLMINGICPRCVNRKY